MFTVYILKSLATGKHYIGSTNNLVRRIEEHNRGQTYSTRHKAPWVLVYKEVYLTSIEAKNREKQIKSYRGGNALKKLLIK